MTLLSDFGVMDGYVAQVKATILRHAPEIEIIDISHQIERHNVWTGSFVLSTTVSFFPKGTVHVAVVDPGVGGRRMPIVLDCMNGVLVGPDNGLLTAAGQTLGFRAAYRITRTFVGHTPSATFHGRDLFAIAAGKIASGFKAEDVGPRLSSVVKLPFPKPVRSKRKVKCTVLHVDAFGNLILNLTGKDIERTLLNAKEQLIIETGNHQQRLVFVKSYSQLGKRKLGLLEGSQGYLEIASREESASALLSLRPRDSLVISFSLPDRSRRYRADAHHRQSASRRKRLT
ncbi:MAG TPA: SAM-dependent chlorinase/fluorinase [Candidatus Bathyarchaeia archaeon]|nr:SAM-dependent chlorinase/fluorinase [Candidatus Bathyarchaeia archaeon]